jgi:hypothetical protein
MNNNLEKIIDPNKLPPNIFLDILDKGYEKVKITSVPNPQRKHSYQLVAYRNKIECVLSTPHHKNNYKLDYESNSYFFNNEKKTPVLSKISQKY